MSAMRSVPLVLVFALSLLLGGCRQAQRNDGAAEATVTISAVELAAPETATADTASEKMTPTPVVHAEVPPTPNPTPTTEISSSSDLPAETIALLQAFLDQQILNDGQDPQRGAPGAVLLVDLPDGRFLAAAGVADLAQGSVMQTDAVFEIGSISKLFTAVLLLQLHEEGILSLDDPLADWLPDVAAALPSGNEITLRQLASHTAGLSDYEHELYPMPLILQESTALEQGYTPQELATWITDRGQPLFAPGAPGQWAYSSAGYALLGLVMEAASGETLSTLYATRIFDPLGMESAFQLEGIPARGQVVSGYNAALGKLQNVTRWNASGAWAAGALAMNASDLAIYAEALQSGQLFGNDESLAEMTTFGPTGQQRGFTGYGLGLAQLNDGNWGHAGGTPGFTAQLLIVPESGGVLIYLANGGSANVNPAQLSALANQVASMQ